MARIRKKRSCKPVSKEQERARWRNFAKMRVAGALSLQQLLKHKFASTLSRDSKDDIDNAMHHLEWAIERWEK